MSDFDFDLSSIQSGGATGMDAFFASEPEVVSLVGEAPVVARPEPIRIGSLKQLEGFTRVSSETLINKSTRDLWAIKPDGNDFVIERLFQDDGQPLKG